MTLFTHTTIAQLLYLDAPPMNFARLVSDLDLVMDRLPGVARTLTWDCEDVAIFEAGTLRVLLAITDAPGTDYAACLTITAGPAIANAPQSSLLRRADQLCRLIERQLASRTQPDATFWHRTPRVATADLVDTMVWSLAGADLIAWATPTPSLPQIDTTPLRPAPPQARPPFGMNLALFRGDRASLTTRSIAVASTLIVASGPQLLALL
jgi:hypothetical protein